MSGIDVGLGLDSFALDLTGSGSVASPEVPAPRSRWQILAGPAGGGYETELTAAQQRKLTLRLKSPSELGFSMNARLDQAEAIEELTTDAHVLWTSPAGLTYRMFRGRFGATGDTLDADSHTMTASALDYRALLLRRRLYSDSTLTWTATDEAEIALGLITQTQARTGGNLGITKAWTGTTPTGISLDQTHAAGDSIGERIQQLSETLDGFDWEITPTSPTALELNVWHPQRGTDRGVILEYGGMVTGVRREVNPSDYGNAGRFTGADGLTAQELAVSDIADRAEGRWDIVHGDTQLLTQQQLNDCAAWQLDQNQTILPSYSVVLERGAWQGPEHIWLGDPVRLIIRSGRLRVDTVIRVFELGFTIDADGNDLVEVTLGRPKPDYRTDVPTESDRRIRNLERR